MTVGAGICIEDNGNLKVLGNTILTNVDNDNVFLTPAIADHLTNAAFIGVRSDHVGSRRVFPLGKLEYVFFLTCYFNTKVLTFKCLMFLRL